MKQVRGTVNSVELVGWLGADPELRFTPSGAQVARFKVATKHMAGRDAEGKRELETDWTPVETWERLAERCSAALHKGSRVLVTGSLRTDSWTDRDTGETRYKTYVRAEDVLFLDPRTAQQEAAEETAETSDEEVAAEEVAATEEDIPF